jgi:hypothetical protein
MLVELLENHNQTSPSCSNPVEKIQIAFLEGKSAKEAHKKARTKIVDGLTVKSLQKGSPKLAAALVRMGASKDVIEKVVEALIETAGISTSLVRRIARLNKRELTEEETISLLKNLEESQKTHIASRIVNAASATVKEAFWSYIKNNHPGRVIPLARSLNRELTGEEIDFLIKFYEQKGLSDEYFIFSKKIPKETKEKLLKAFEGWSPPEVEVEDIIKRKLTTEEIQLMLKTACEERHPTDALLLLRIVYGACRRIPTEEIRKLTKIV